MASEALAGEADQSSASSLPSGDKAAGNQAVKPVDEKDSSEHVSDARAEANQQQQSNGSGNGDVAAASRAPSVQKSNAILCGVCESNPGKYKCSRCRLPYCSVACSRAHQQNHPPDLPKEDPKPIDQASNALPAAAAASANMPPPGHVDPANPFSALATSDRLQLLFKKYPNLPNQLLEIHAATQPPPEAPDAASKAIPASLMKGLPPSSGRSTWNHDIGIKNGKAALRKARKASGQDGEAIREYTELILHIMNETGDRNKAAAYVQRQIAEQDTALIERLLAEDRRNE
ncbi:hypothetical protein TARUN_6571 [Trichoderma arundinaceum]|uniref:HIT-type domain-containing protein n=1 Tax=Trichoderma arundinaceum TaxID=490622 RepID=A0A395NHW2_TRIAR|nr:hypothetical protein TARUN_6571 [Trichoderma arundinaceum]